MMRHRRRRAITGLYRHPRRSSADFWIKIILITGVAFFFLWVIYQLGVRLFGNINTTETFAELQVLKGQARWQTAGGSENWTIILPEQKIFSGESVKTSPGGVANIILPGIGHLVLDSESEVLVKQLEKDGEKKQNIIIDVKVGHVWLGTEESEKEITRNLLVITPKQKIRVNGTVMDLEITPDQETIRMVRGSSTITIDTIEGEKEIKIGVGQQITWDKATIAKLDSGTSEENLIRAIDSSFRYQSWHIQNMEIFSPKEGARLRRELDLRDGETADKKEDKEELSNEEQEIPISKSVPLPEILAPKNGDVIAAIPADEFLKIEGLAPEEAFQIEVNGYALSRYQPGNKKWSYVASETLGNLRKGSNIFSVSVITRDGKKSEPVVLTVEYKGTPNPPKIEAEETEKPESENTKKPAEKTEKVVTAQGPDTISFVDFAAPTVSSPVYFATESSDPYQTSAQVVTIRGTVPPSTESVIVNGFKLKKFQPGDTTYAYIANASYDNMKPGTNEYSIRAFHSDGRYSQKKITIVYTPIQ